MGAALAFYTAFSLAPLLILIIALGGFLFGPARAEAQIIYQIRQLIGNQGAEAIRTLIDAARQPATGFFATAIGVFTLLIGATGALVELQDGLNRVWKVPEGTGGLGHLLFQRVASLTLVLAVAFLLLVSLVISATLAAVGTFLSGRYPLNELGWQGIDFFLSWGVITILFAMIYKILPETAIHWRDVWIGAAATSLLFVLGKFLVGLYIGKSAITSAYGAAGSFAVVLIWVYYSSLLLYYGAEFTKAYADRFGSRNPAAG